MEGMLVCGITLDWIASQVGVSNVTAGRWYRGERGMSAGQALFLTSLLATMIEAGGEGLDSGELSERDRQALRIKLDTARAWYSLQALANEELPDGCEHEALAIRDARLTALRRQIAPEVGAPPRRNAEFNPRKHEARPTAGKQSGSGSIRRNTPTRGASGE
ncbi:hypothetical protein Q8W71_30930 [Methylobacterium sp. NEAU 140]|uniref:hypothetical protein n=1 Tax=Methylobacterium sp. NEAU 140 TaxID=3064945 RepID=UPI00273524C1|nr:hypothetical protein [Methylobacterium sp. NEAU 140]MDP4027007.1 hypothetical protein [Methylobacterium sp. NEAU 140]